MKDTIRDVLETACHQVGDKTCSNIQDMVMYAKDFWRMLASSTEPVVRTLRATSSPNGTIPLPDDAADVMGIRIFIPEGSGRVQTVVSNSHLLAPISNEADIGGLDTSSTLPSLRMGYDFNIEGRVLRMAKPSTEVIIIYQSTDYEFAEEIEVVPQLAMYLQFYVKLKFAEENLANKVPYYREDMQQARALYQNFMLRGISEMVYNDNLLRILRRNTRIR